MNAAKTFDKQTAKLIAVVSENMPEFSGDRMQAWIQNPKAVQRALRKSFCSHDTETHTKFVSAFTINWSFKMSAASELVKQGEYFLVMSEITDTVFPRSLPGETRQIELIEIDHNLGTNDVLKELECYGLKRPTWQDALQFGIEYPEEQRKRPIVFLHEPILTVCGRRVIMLSSDKEGNRYLEVQFTSGIFTHPCAFAGVREF
ncbi:MAG: hypothetical protein V1756_00525 [Patescibacteria group bacterium]